MINRYKVPLVINLQKERLKGAGSKPVKFFINLGIAPVDQSVSGNPAAFVLNHKRN